MQNLRYIQLNKLSFALSKNSKTNCLNSSITEDNVFVLDVINKLNYNNKGGEVFMS